MEQKTQAPTAKGLTIEDFRSKEYGNTFQLLQSSNPVVLDRITNLLIGLTEEELLDWPQTFSQMVKEDLTTERDMARIAGLIFEKISQLYLSLNNPNNLYVTTSNFFDDIAKILESDPQITVSPSGNKTGGTNIKWQNEKMVIPDMIVYAKNEFGQIESASELVEAKMGIKKIPYIEQQWLFIEYLRSNPNNWQQISRLLVAQSAPPLLDEPDFSFTLAHREGIGEQRRNNWQEKGWQPTEMPFNRHDVYQEIALFLKKYATDGISSMSNPVTSSV